MHDEVIQEGPLYYCLSIPNEEVLHEGEIAFRFKAGEPVGVIVNDVQLGHEQARILYCGLTDPTKLLTK